MSNGLYKKKIADLVEVFNNIRVPLSANQRLKLEKKFPYYGAQGIVDYVNNFLFDGEYLLVAEDGENLRSNNQNICNLVKGKFWVNNHAHILRANKENDNKYLYYNFNRIKFEPYVTGSSQPKLNKENLLSIVTSVHLLKEQQKIASVLSALDDKIELNNRINAELEAIAKTLYDYWFIQFDFPTQSHCEERGTRGEAIHNKKIASLHDVTLAKTGYKSSGGKMVYNETLKREIPEGWEVKTVGEFAKIKKGTLITEKTANTNGNIKVVSAGLDFSYYHSESNFPNNTITVSASGANAGYINFWREPIFACDCTTVRGNSDFETFYILQFLKSVQEFIYSQARGSAQPHVYPKDIEALKIIIPNEEILHKYVKIVYLMNEKITNNLKQNQELSALRDWLLPMLMNGQVSVGEWRVENFGMVAEEQVKYKK